MLTTDYLVVGAGAAGLAFVDTVLTEQPNVHVTIIDKKEAPGGHWNDAYGHVRLHQPSLLYGVASEQMEGNWLWLLVRHQTLFFNHRASKTEILTYYRKWMDKWIKSGRVSFFANSTYDFKASQNQQGVSSKTHVFSTMQADGTKRTQQIRVNVKLVNAILGENVVPSQHGPKFPVSKEAIVITPNELYDQHQAAIKKTKKQASSSSTSATDIPQYVVMGAGKTGMDAVVYLQREMGVPASQITWIISNDVWMIRREGPGLPGSWPLALLENDLNIEKAALSLEEQTVFVRLDKEHMPSRFRFPSIGKDELPLLRKITNIVRQGRITSIEGTGTLHFAKGGPVEFPVGTQFVHCTSPGPFNGNKELSLFPTDDLMNLWFLYAPPVPISMSVLGHLESRLQQGTLDMEFGRKLCGALVGEDKAKTLSDREILNQLIRGIDIASDVVSDNPASQVNALITDAAVLSIADSDPKKSLAWQVSNRLSTRSIPGFKVGIYETMEKVKAKADMLGLSSGEKKMVTMMADKLKVLEGK